MKKPAITFLLLTGSFLLSCNPRKSTETSGHNPVNTTSPADGKNNTAAVLDSIRSCKPLKLSLSEDHSDVDELIPLGYNDHGSFAYLVNENSGGSSGLHFGIIPAYEDFKLESRLGMDEETDSILLRNRELITAALHSQGIKLQQQVQQVPADSLQKNYGIRFEVKKTYGPRNPDDPSGKKTLATVEISWRQGDSEYPSFLVNKRFSPAWGVYDLYISDCLLIPGQEGSFGFVVLVTEESGFEGYTRKSIEVEQIGVVKGK